MELLDLDEARAELNKISAIDDVELLRMIDGITPVVEDVVGAVLPRNIVDEQHRGRSGTVLLFERPVLEVTSVIEYINSRPQIVTKVDNPGAAVVNSYTVNKATGELTRMSVAGSGNAFNLTGAVIGGYQMIWAPIVYVSYTAGRAGVPANISQGALVILRHRWSSQRGQSSQVVPSYEAEPTVATPSGFLIPFEAMGLLQPDAVGSQVA